MKPMLLFEAYILITIAFLEGTLTQYTLVITQKACARDWVIGFQISQRKIVNLSGTKLILLD
jgi:hypothetical protein